MSKEKLDVPYWIESDNQTIQSTTTPQDHKLILCPECDGFGIYHKTTGTICRKCEGEGRVFETVVEVKIYHKLCK